LRRYRISQLQD